MPASPAPPLAQFAGHAGGNPPAGRVAGSATVIACAAGAHEPPTAATTIGAALTVLQQWLHVALIVSLALLLGAYAGTAWQLVQGRLNAAPEQLEDVVRVMTEHAQASLHAAALVSGRVGDMLGDDELPPQTLTSERQRQLHVKLRDMVNAMPYLRAIEVWNADGRPMVSSLQHPITADRDAAGHDYFVFHKRPAAGLFISDPGPPDADGETQLRFSRRRDGADGRFMGVVVLTLAPRLFGDHYRDHHRERWRDTGIAVALARADGLVVNRFPDGALPGTAMRFDARWASTLFERDRDGLRREFDNTGELTAMRRISGWPFHVIARVRRDPILAGTHEPLTRLALHALGTAATLLLSWLVMRGLLDLRAARQAEQAERERRQAAEEALRQAQKLEAVGQLTGGVAHDFNNLMMVVGTNLQIIQLKDKSATFEREVAAIGRAIHNGQSLTRQLMAFSRRRPLQIERIDLADQLAPICELARHSLRGGVTLEHAVRAGTWTVQVDVSELELAVINLVVNARDAMPHGGPIYISTANVVIDSDIGAADPVRGEFVAIAVRDHGSGIPAALRQRVFEPFFTTKEPGKGTGLGLAQVHGFARTAGGTVLIESPAGSATRVLPLATGSMAADTAGAAATVDAIRVAPAPEATPSGNIADLPVPAASASATVTTLAGPGTAPPGTIVTLLLPRADTPGGSRGERRPLVLVAEANPAVGESITALLEQLGYDARLTRDALEVRDALINGLPCDLLLVDLALQGGMSCRELVQVVRERFPALPVVLMSSFAADDPRGKEEGLVTLSKPFDVAELTTAMRQQLAPGDAPGSV